jgi:hypothetical protein
MTVTTSDRIFAAGVPLRINDELTINLKFNMLSAMAQEHRFSSSNPLMPLMKQKEGTFITDTVMFILGSGCLHAGSGVEVDMAGLKLRTATPEEEADRLAGLLSVELESADAHPLLNAIAKAQDIAAPIPTCHTCDHAFSDHDWIDNVCSGEGCKCENYTRPEAEAAPKAKAATTGRASTSQRRTTKSASGTSG